MIFSDCQIYLYKLYFDLNFGRCFAIVVFSDAVSSRLSPVVEVPDHRPYDCFCVMMTLPRFARSKNLPAALTSRPVCVARTPVIEVASPQPGRFFFFTRLTLSKLNAGVSF
jgi:hypothetical protein